MKDVKCGHCTFFQKHFVEEHKRWGKCNFLPPEIILIAESRMIKCSYYKSLDNNELKDDENERC